MYKVDTKTGLLTYTHECEVCSRYPRKDNDEECGMCGYTNKQVEARKHHVERMNEAYNEKYGQRGVFD